MKFSAIFAILTLASAAAAAPAESSTHQDANNIIIRNDVNDGSVKPHPPSTRNKLVLRSVRLLVC